MSLYKERQQSTSLSRIPLYQGKSDESEGSGKNKGHLSERERSSSLTNYNGKIPRMKSNEKIEEGKIKERVV